MKIIMAFILFTLLILALLPLDYEELTVKESYKWKSRTDFAKEFLTEEEMMIQTRNDTLQVLLGISDEVLSATEDQILGVNSELIISIKNHMIILTPQPGVRDNSISRLLWQLEKNKRNIGDLL